MDITKVATASLDNPDKNVEDFLGVERIPKE